MTSRSRAKQVLGLVGVLLVVILVWFGQGDGDPAHQDNTLSAHVFDTEISLDQLPPEAQRTIELIGTDGPFPYRHDGSTFGNRERLLPAHPSGYYREFTVPTPGSRDRGARRIVLGDSGEMFYTEDHYRSFSSIDLNTRE